MPRKQGHTAKGACDRAVDEMGYEGLVPVGDVGTGKTHMACALAAACCARGWEARFFTASSLVLRLRRARDDGRLDRELSQIGRARLLVVDELGFLPLGPDVRRRADGGRGDRSGGTPRQAPQVQGRVVPRQERAHGR